MKRWLVLVLLLGVVVGGRAEEARRQLLIAAAADLQFALEEVLAEFGKAHPEHRARATYGSSGTLFAQIDNGAPFDVFLSADLKFPQQLLERGRAEGRVFRYAIGHLAIWARKDAPVDVSKAGAEGLLREEVRRVSMANPEVAPYGAAAVATLKKLGIYERLQPKLVFGDNVAQAAHFAEFGSADAGVISLSLALSPRLKNAGKHWRVPADADPGLMQGGIIRSGALNRAGAIAFRDFLLKGGGGAILERYGFERPELTR